ncbi:hypothetical protein BFJ65_g7820 [Fusarium oxysporum f. sp. cepae]|uniref:Uncharacterized protein n=1 Tax=Fusarium oxysporum f. sp. cepae TaxID=396571 RepID=A0A3L6NI67_FUSOX|nr:hypothetical protein BFJ65_g7820 [Fusarium oxysporum f. sp. cepae]RKK64520.1 hypothetical protein BFJ67_g477 [Fusarium oxysporum f. sp. cepae]
MAEQDKVPRRRDWMKRFLLPLRKTSSTNQEDVVECLETRTFPSGIKALCSPEGATTDVVFVHGLNGNRERTWTAQGATEPWPKTLLPVALPKARVLAFGYDASVADWRGMVSQSRIGNHSWNLLIALAGYRDNDGTNERPIIFVCHSLGGLVCEDALVISGQRPERHLKNITRSVHGIIFLGTPHHGAGLARWAELVSRYIGLVKQTNSNIVQVLRRESEVLARIQDSFHTMIKSRITEGLSPIEISCFYEELPLPGVGLVVPQDSAILPGYIPVGIHGDHMGMTKFASQDDPGFVAVCGELQRWAREIDEVERRPKDLLPASSSNLKEQPVGANQQGHGNRQYNNFGTGTQKNVNGFYLEGGSHHFEHHHHHHRSESSTPQAYRVIPLSRNEDITNRADIFAQLNTLLPLTPENQSAALHGLGGSGKTQIALEYAHRRCRDPDWSVFWVQADNETTFTQSYKAIARAIDIRDDLDGEKLLATVRERIERLPRWLLVLDNADDLTMFGIPPGPPPIYLVVLMRVQ